MNYDKVSLALHKQLRGKIHIAPKIHIRSKADLSTAYTPGVAAPSRTIANNPQTVYTYTNKGNMVAILTDGSAVLGLGNIGPEAALPVMEGKAVLFKEFANVDAMPLTIATQDTQEIMRTAQFIAPTFGGINLEDISAPRCFEIEEKLDALLDIPVFHDDQHGTAIVVLAGLLNALRVVGKRMQNCTVVVNGSGAAGTAITKLLQSYPQKPKNIIMADSKGIISRGRNHLNPIKESLARITNSTNLLGTIQDALVGADIFIGVSKGNVLTAQDIRRMAPKSIVFAMANPTPEIMPPLAKKAGAVVVATGRSDFPNQVNNVLAFPGIFRGALDVRALSITPEMKYAAAHALANLVSHPTAGRILPSPIDRTVARTVAKAVRRAARVN